MPKAPIVDEFERQQVKIEQIRREQEAAPPKPAPPKQPTRREVLEAERVTPPKSEPYVPPENAKVVARDAKGEPTILQTPDGVKHFTPAQTVMWGKLGFATEKEWVKSQRTGKPSQFVGITAGVDTPIRVSRAAMIDAGKMKEAGQQFEAYRRIGVIPVGSKFVLGPKGTLDKNWSYIHPDTIKQIKAQEIARQAASRPKQPTRREVFEADGAIDLGKTIELADGKLIAISDFNELPFKYQTIGMRQGFDAMSKRIDTDIKEYTRKHIIINNKGLPIDQWNELPEKYQNIALRQGLPIMIKAVKADEAAQNKAITAMDKYKTDTGFDLLTAAHEGVSRNTMILAGFDKESADWAMESRKASKETGVALPGVREWQDIRTNKIITSAEYQKLEDTDEAGFYRLSVPSGRRLAIEGASALFFSPARMALPEVKKGDIKPIDYAIGTAQLAVWALPVVPKGIVPYASAGISSIFGLHTATNWGRMGAGQKSLGVVVTVLTAIPAIGAIAKTAIPVAVKVPTAAGELTVWKGVNFRGKPIIGISGGKLAVGTKGVRLPEFADISTGFKPATKIETSLLGTRKALKQMGVAEADIVKVETTLDTRGMFAGKKSPFLSKEIQPEGIKSLSPEGVGEVFKASVAEGKKVEKLYGSYTMKPQLDPKLRLWRKPGDIDIQTSMSQAETEAFTSKLAATLKRTEGANNVRISPKTPTLIEVKDATGWHHAVDIHAFDVSSIASEVEKLGTTGAYSFGMKIAEPVATIKYPGVGTLKIMRLSETGKRKADAILHYRKTGIMPEPHRVKDIVDYYVILRTFKGQQIADKWAVAWGKNPAMLMKMAAKDPPKLTAWELAPEAVPTKGSPSISVDIPSYMSVGLSPALRASIASSVVMSPSAAASNYTVRASPSAVSVSTPAGKSPSLIIAPSVSLKAISAKVSGGVKPLPKGMSASAKVSGTPIPKPSAITPSPKPSPVPSPKPSPVAKPSLAVPPKPSPAPVPSPAPSPVPSPVPSPKPSPVPSPSPVPEPVPEIDKPPPPVTRPRRGASDKEKRKTISASGGGLAWRQGELGGKDVWHVIMSPYASEADYLTVLGRKPSNTTVVRGPGSAFQTIKLRFGKPPAKTVTGDIGFMDFRIEPKSDRFIGIGFTPDPKQLTTGDITIGRRALPITERQPGLGRGKSPRITPQRPRLRR